MKCCSLTLISYKFSFGWIHFEVSAADLTSDSYPFHSITYFCDKLLSTSFIWMNFMITIEGEYFCNWCLRSILLLHLCSCSEIALAGGASYSSRSCLLTSPLYSVLFFFPVDSCSILEPQKEPLQCISRITGKKF